jgi:GNAT superfamily N-acetyltransferase
MAHWRQMTEDDLGGVMTVAEAVHPDLPETREVIAERLALYPAGCLVLDDGGAVGGYAVSHPIRQGQPPQLNCLLGSIREDADVFYIHDVALMPVLRGGGHAAQVVGLILDLAQNYGRVGLIAVYDAASFWSRFGFVPSHVVGHEKLAAYGKGATFMEKVLVPSACGAGNGPGQATGAVRQ